MEKAKRRVRICLLCVVMLAIVMGILYYYHDLGESGINADGTLISSVNILRNAVWR